MRILDVNEKTIADYVQAKRPPLEVRNQLDFRYSFKNYEVILYKIRPDWCDESIMRELPFARCEYVKSLQIWEIYWMRASGKWKLYKPTPQVSNVESFIKIIESDVYGCFFG